MRKFLLMAVAGVGLMACTQQPGQPTPAQNAGTTGGCEAMPSPMPGSSTTMSGSAIPTRNPSGGTDAMVAAGGTGQRSALPGSQNAAGGCEAMPPGATGPTSGALPARPAGR